MRVATELPWGLDGLQVDAWIRIAQVPIKSEQERLFSYDQPQYQLADLTLANCVAHLFRERGVTRFGLPNLGEYPEQFKSLAPLFLAYSYPNVVNELAGTDMKVASVLKIVRTIMLDTNDKGASGVAMDEQMVADVYTTRDWLVENGFATPDLFEIGLDSPLWLRKIKKI